MEWTWRIGYFYITRLEFYVVNVLHGLEWFLHLNKNTSELIIFFSFWSFMYKFLIVFFFVLIFFIEIFFILFGVRSYRLKSALISWTSWIIVLSDCLALGLLDLFKRIFYCNKLFFGILINNFKNNIKFCE